MLMEFDPLIVSVVSLEVANRDVVFPHREIHGKLIPDRPLADLFPPGFLPIQNLLGVPPHKESGRRDRIISNPALVPVMFYLGLC